MKRNPKKVEDFLSYRSAISGKDSNQVDFKPPGSFLFLKSEQKDVFPQQGKKEINPPAATYTQRDVTKGMDLVRLDHIPLDQPFNNFIKRSFDICFSLLMTIVLIPVYIVIAILVVLESKGPIFYSPKRTGKGGISFYCYKFRTMYSLDKSGEKSTVRNDPRITRVGTFLRKYNLDELPQFLNVLQGNMSVVGPRPHRLKLNKALETMVSQYMLRHQIKPGITGWAQVNGWRGPLETQKQRVMRVRFDLQYIKDWTLWMDIKIIYLTVFSKKAFKDAF